MSLKTQVDELKGLILSQPSDSHGREKKWNYFSRSWNHGVVTMIIKTFSDLKKINNKLINPCPSNVFSCLVVLLLILDVVCLFLQRSDQTGWLWFGPALQFRGKVRRECLSSTYFPLRCMQYIGTSSACVCNLNKWLNMFMMVDAVIKLHHEYGFSSSIRMNRH